MTYKEALELKRQGFPQKAERYYFMSNMRGIPRIVKPPKHMREIYANTEGVAAILSEEEITNHINKHK